MNFTVTVNSGENTRKIEYNEPVSLSSAIIDSGFDFDSPCGGLGICGNCKVYVNGTVTPPKEKEREFLGEDINNGYRLACMTNAVGDTTIYIPKVYVGNPVNSNEINFDIMPISKSKKCYACALDIGTTSLILRYFSLPDGKLIHSETLPNPQRKHGLDILTRIDFASNGGLQELKDELEDSIEKSKKRFGNEIEYYVITGNTSMLHILAGKSPKGLAVAPFMPETLFGHWDSDRYFMKCSSSYIGADAVASLLASRITESDNKSIIVDIGTNNECILWDGSNLYACSSPAGPAFEGGNISCGMTATDNAIFRIEDINSEPKIFTVNNSNTPKGFCGSGLIDAVAYLLKNDYIAKDGTVLKQSPSFGNARLLPEDVAELQLAKSAVCAGILTLLNYSKLQISAIDTVYLTGNFGNFININNAKAIGLIPKDANAVSLKLGAIDGASMVLLSSDFLRKSEELAAKIQTVELSDSDFFKQAFIENLFF